jgi:hypothetical protein
MAGVSLLFVAVPLRGAPLDTPTGRLSLDRIASVSDAENLRRAILSVHAFVEKHRRPMPGERREEMLVDLLDHVDPMPIGEAMSTIKKDPSPQGDLNRRRALLRLLSWVRDVDGVRAAVEDLVGSADKTKEIYRRLAAVDRGGACQTAETPEQERANAVLNDELGKVPYGRCAHIDAQLATVTNKGGNIIVASKVIAEAPLDGARAGLDPQRWQTCSPLWRESFLVKTDSSGNIIDNGQCTPTDDVDCLPARGTSVAYGTSYDTDVVGQPFFEKFVCDGGWCDVRVLLRIIAASASPPLAYELTYERPKPWQAFPYPPRDDGTLKLSAVDIPGDPTNKALTVTADKTFAFGTWTTDFSIYFMLRRVEMANYLADLVCCENP